MRVAIYARVSTSDQHAENQLAELRRYVQAREWAPYREYVDEGVSGAKESRPALDRLLQDARRRRFDAVLVWRLDRLGRNLRHLILLLDDLQALGVAFVSLAEGLDCTTPAGRLQLHVLGAIAEFERERIRERVIAGLARAKTQGKRLGRPVAIVPVERLVGVSHLSVEAAAGVLGVSRSTLKRWRKLARQVQQVQQTPGSEPALSPLSVPTLALARATA
jgi:putative DNA-invertase from lambdoid prophage Rac